MDHLTNLYRNRAETLAAKVKYLEEQLSLLNEATPPATAFRTGDKSQAAWSDLELENRARSIKKGGLFQKVNDEQQSQEWKDIQAELGRRKQPKAETKTDTGVRTVPVGPGEGSGIRKVPGTEAPSGRVPKQPMAQPKSEKIALPEPKGPLDTGRQRPQPAPQPVVGGPGAGGVSPKKAETTAAGTGKEETWSMDPKLAVGAIGAGLYLGNKVAEKFARQRGGPAAPAEPTKAPRPKAPEATKTQAGKTPAPETPKPKVGEKVRVPDSMKKGTYLFDLPAQAEWTMNPPEWEMKGREKFSVPQTSVGPKKPFSKPGLERAAGTPMTGEIPERPLPAETTIGGKQIAKGKGTVADRAAVGRDLLRARAEAAKAVADAKAKAVAPAFQQTPAEPTVKQGDMSTKEGKVVSKGSQVSSKIGRITKGTLRGAGSLGAALGGEMAVEKGLEALGVENETVKGVVAPTVGWAAGEGALATGLGLARGLGFGAAVAGGAAAAVPAAIYGALAYPSYKAAEASKAAMEKEAQRIRETGSATKARFTGPKY
jgi:hypothetical protein